MAQISPGFFTKISQSSAEVVKLDLETTLYEYALIAELLACKQGFG